jgi:hypothetical protein
MQPTKPIQSEDYITSQDADAGKTPIQSIFFGQSLAHFDKASRYV